MPPIPPDQRPPYGTPAAPSASPAPAAVQLASRHGDRGGGDDDDNTPRRFLTGPGVCRRYNITDMALWRWLNDAELQFPRPTLVVKGRRYWLESELQNWERSPSARQTQRRNKPPQRR